MTDLRKAAEMALEVMEYNRANGTPNMGAAIEALRQALAQPEQEPVAWITECQEIGPNYGKKRFDALPIQSLNPLMYKHTPLYTAPPKREWQGLMDEEIDGIYKTHHDQYGKCQTGGFDYERSIEAKLKDKNT